MKKLIFFALITANFLGCSSQPEEIKEESIYVSESPNLKMALSNFQLLFEQVDRVYKEDTSRIELFLQVGAKDPIKRVPNYNDVPESFNATFNIVRNKSGQIIFISESPRSESGDWDVSYKSYYGGEGNLVAFIRRSSFFNGGCAEIVFEKSEYFYDSEQSLVKKTYEITDGDKKPLDHTKCVFNYRYDYEICKNLSSYLQKHKFEK